MAVGLIGYNTKLVKAEEAPRVSPTCSIPSGRARSSSRHPGYSGTIMTATYQMSRDIGWALPEKLAAQKVMQVQSSADPPKKLALGERAVMADGNEYNLVQLKEEGRTGRDRLSDGRHAADRRAVRDPEGRAQSERGAAAAVLLFRPRGPATDYRLWRVAVGACADREQAGRKPLKDIKPMKDDAVAVEKEADYIKARYTKIFRV